MDLRIVHKATLFSLFFFCSLACISQSGVSVKASVDRNSILIGERINLRFEADIPENQPIHFFTIDTIDHFEFLDRGKIDTINTSTGTKLRQQFVLTSFDSGRWVIPSYTLDFQNEIKTDSFIIHVSFIPFDTAQAYHDIKNIIEVEVEKKEDYTRYYIIAGSALLFLLLVYLLTRRKKPKKITEVVTDPFADAMKELQQLQKQALPPKEFYTKLTDIFRTYIARRKKILSMQKTTDDLVIQLRSLQMKNDQFQQLSLVLRLSDFVKFAKYQPLQDENRLAFDTIKNSIQAIEKMVS